MRGDKNERPLTSILSPSGERKCVFKYRVKISKKHIATTLYI
jgi:hypothetical protein